MTVSDTELLFARDPGEVLAYVITQLMRCLENA